MTILRFAIIFVLFLPLGCSYDSPENVRFRAEFRAKALQEDIRKAKLESLEPDIGGEGPIYTQICGDAKLKECIRESREAGFLLKGIDSDNLSGNLGSFMIAGAWGAKIHHISYQKIQNGKTKFSFKGEKKTPHGCPWGV